MTELLLQFCLDSKGRVSIFLVYFLERRILGPVLSCGAVGWDWRGQSAGLVGRKPGFQPGSLALQASDAMMADFMSHILPKNNWSELRVLSSVSKAFHQAFCGYGLGFRVRPGLEFKSLAAYINSICLHFLGGEKTAHSVGVWGG